MSNNAAFPLQGKRVLVTRTREQASVLSAGLQALGATPIEFPTLQIVPPTDWTQLDTALKRLARAEQADDTFTAYDWLVFTSANGVHICLQRFQTLGYDPHTLQYVRIATIGPATEAALEQYGLKANLIPDAYVAEGVAEAIIADAHRRGVSLTGQHLLLARAAEARLVLATTLRGAGAVVDDIPTYHTRTAAIDDERGRELWHMVQQHQLDILTFASSSTVKNFMTWLRQCSAAADVDIQPAYLPPVACIGPITAQTARDLGLAVAVEARESTIDELLNAITEYYSVL